MAICQKHIANSLTVVANRTNGASWLRPTVSKAAHMRDAGAYMHWYERYGFERADLDTCLETCRKIIGDYEALGAD
eukprot:SAG31_NODE_11947_length_983_cov_0.704751_1_plen_76_part_00